MSEGIGGVAALVGLGMFGMLAGQFSTIVRVGHVRLRVHSSIHGIYLRVVGNDGTTFYLGASQTLGWAEGENIQSLRELLESEGCTENPEKPGEFMGVQGDEHHYTWIVGGETYRLVVKSAHGPQAAMTALKALREQVSFSSTPCRELGPADILFRLDQCRMWLNPSTVQSAAVELLSDRHVIPLVSVQVMDTGGPITQADAVLLFAKTGQSWVEDTVDGRPAIVAVPITPERGAEILDSGRVMVRAVVMHDTIHYAITSGTGKVSSGDDKLERASDTLRMQDIIMRRLQIVADAQKDDEEKPRGTPVTTG